MSRPPIAVVGVHHTPLTGPEDGQSLEEMIFAAARGALGDAGLRADEVDGVVLATADQVHGRVIESMVANGAAGGVGRDVTTLASAGEHAFVYAYLRLLAGQGRRLLVMAWGKESESVDPSHAELVAAEPFLLRSLGLKNSVAAGLQASSYAARHGLEAQAVEAVRVARAQAANAAHGLAGGDGAATDDRIVAWPLTAADMPRSADVAAAVVLAAGDAVTREHVPAWVHGMGWSTERYDLGERDLSRFAALEAAAGRAFGDGFTAAQAGVVEVQEISTVGGFAACEALGLCEPGDGGRAATGDAPVVNPSGGNLPAHAANAAGFLRFVAAAQQVRGRAGAAQVSSDGPMTAVGAALHGFAGQGAAVAVFSAQRERRNLQEVK